LPWNLNCERSVCRTFGDSDVEDRGDDDEEAEEQDLDEETSCYCTLAVLLSRCCFGCCEHATTYIVSGKFSKWDVERIVPPDCAKNDRTSPPTKTFVNHFARISECSSPSAKRMIRPRIM
jgi:hypothetical protein